MNTQLRPSIVFPTIVMIGLAAAYAILIAAGQYVTDAYSQAVMISTGSVILGAGLVFFLLRVSAIRGK